MIPDARSFLKDLEAKLRTMRDPRFEVQIEADTSQGRRETSAWRREEQRNALNVSIDADLADAVAEMTKWRREQERRGIDVPVDVDYEAAKMALDMFRRDQESRAVNVDVDADTAAATLELNRWRAMQQADPVNVNVKVDVDRSGVDGVSRQLEGLRRSDVLRLNVGALGLAGLQPAISALAELAASIQQVSQAGIALPGIFAGAAASIGTLVLGLSGVSDAYKAVSDASDSAGKDQAANAQAALSASNSLRNAVVDERRAREDLARATRDSARELRDLRTEQRGGMIDESRAILEARKAREDLARGNYTDVRDAVLRIEEADQRLIETRNRNMDTADKLNEANAKGVTGSDRVVDASERLVRSQQAVAEAQLAAAAASTKQSSAQEKAAETMGKLGPNARQLVDTMVRLTPEFEKFRASISDPLLEGKAQEFEDFFTKVRPVAERGLRGIAEGWNQNISAFLGSVGSQRGTSIIDRILGNTGDAQKRLSAAVSPLVEGVGVLTAAGTDALPRLADGFADVLDRFRDFIVEADENGDLDRWINDGIDGVSMLGESLLNAGKTFTAITKAAGGGGEFLNWLRDATGRLQTFLNSTEGQSKLREYFDQGREAIRQIVPLLQELPGMFKALGEGGAKYVGLLLPVLETVASLIGDHPELISTAVAAWLTWKTVSPIMSGLQAGINAFNNGIIGIGTNFAGTRQKAQDETSRIDKAFKDAGKEGSGLNKFSRGVGALAFAGGPFGILASTILSVALPALVQLTDGMDDAAEKTDDLRERQESLEQTLDRVSGKLTAQSLDSQLDAAQNFDPKDADRTGVGGVKQRDALAAAAALGISPEVYGKALLNDPNAQNQIRDVLLKNNLIPEFAANQDLAKRADAITAQTGGAISRDLLLQALIGSPGAVDEYNRILADKARGNPSLMQRGNLADIAGSLSQTGQQSVLAGGALGYLTGQVDLGQQTTQANQARFGRFRLNDQGRNIIGGDWQVNATGPQTSDDTKYRITSPAGVDLSSRVEELKRQGIDAVYNEYARVWELTVPKDSPLIEGYKTGGPTKGPRSRGFLAELHGQEWVHDADTVQTYGRDVMNAMWRKQIDPKALKGLLPQFATGGPTDPNDPNYVGIATGQTPGGMMPGPTFTAGPGEGVAPNPYGADGQGGINGIATQVLSGAQGPISQLTNGLFSNLGMTAPGQGGQQQSGLMPGLWGLAQAGGDPALMQQWGQQTTNWLVNDWLGGTVMNGLMNSVLPQVLDSVGLGGILQSPYVRGLTGTLNHFMQAVPGAQANATAGGVVTMPDGTQLPVEQFLTPTSGGTATPTSAMLQQLLGGGGANSPVPPVAVPSPTGPGNGGLQINTLKGKAIIQANFPWATDIGGVRADALKWHPSGLALDVMIPGAGDLNDPTPPEGKAMGDKLYAWLMARKDELGIDYIMWQEKDHYNHLHVNFAPSGYPDGHALGGLIGFKHGGMADPTTRRSGERLTGPGTGTSDSILARVSNGEFITRASSVDKYGLPFMKAINEGRLDPDIVASLPGFAWGGSVQNVIKMAAIPAPKPPPPNPARNPAKVPQVAPPKPPPVAQPRPQPAPTPSAPAPGAPAAPATPQPQAPPPVAQQKPTSPTFTPDDTGEFGGSVAPPGPTDHTLPWINQAIDSGAQALGQALSTAMGVAGGAAGGFGGSALGALGPYAAGLVMQGGKVVKDVANVISSALVGSVPGSFTTTPEAYGRTLVSEPNVPQTAMPPFTGRSANYFIQGVDTRNMLGELQLRENIESQSALANHPGRL